MRMLSTRLCITFFIHSIYTIHRWPIQFIGLRRVRDLRLGLIKLIEIGMEIETRKFEVAGGMGIDFA